MIKEKPGYTMELVTLEGIGAMTGSELDAQAKLYAAEAKGLPHYSLLRDRAVRREALRDGKAHAFSDDSGNIIIFGFYQCGDDSDYFGFDCQKPSAMKVLFDSGLLHKKDAPEYDDSRLPKPGAYVETWLRGVGSGFLDNMTDSSLQWVNEHMARREKAGKAGRPYIYIWLDRTPTTLKSVWDKYGAWIISGLAIAMTLVTGGLLTPIAAGAIKGALYLFDAVIKKGWDKLTFSDIAPAAVSLAPALVGTTNLIGATPQASSGILKDAAEYAKTGATLYEAVASKDYLKVASALGINSTGVAQKVMEDLKASDVMGAASKINLSTGKIDKITQAMQNSEMMKSFVQDFDEVSVNAITDKNPFGDISMQQFALNLLASPDLTTGVPCAAQAANVIAKSREALSDAELTGLIKAVQGQDVPKGTFDAMTLDALKQRAMTYKGKTFVLPSCVPAALREEYAGKIRKETGVMVMLPVTESQKFWAEFI